MALLILVLHTIVSICILVLKMREARFWPKMKFEPIFFQVLWQFFNPKGSLPQAGGRGVWGGFRPPHKFWAESVRIFSNFIITCDGRFIDRLGAGVMVMRWFVP